MALSKACLTAEKAKEVTLLQSLSKHFEIDLTIKVFGISIIKFHWPPKNS